MGQDQPVAANHTHWTVCAKGISLEPLPLGM